jgi:hypothetical protein
MKQQTLFEEKLEIYCIDSSSLINLFRNYPRNKCNKFTSLWEELDKIIKNGQIISHITVFKEIYRKDDEINNWCQNHKNIFRDIDECQRYQIREIEKRYSERYWQARMNGGEWADPWIIALAICENAIIVSDERNSPDRIPYIASLFGITTLNLLDFFRDIGLELQILETKWFNQFTFALSNK